MIRKLVPTLLIYWVLIGMPSAAEKSRGTLGLAIREYQSKGECIRDRDAFNAGVDIKAGPGYYEQTGRPAHCIEVRADHAYTIRGSGSAGILFNGTRSESLDLPGDNQSP